MAGKHGSTVVLFLLLAIVPYQGQARRVLYSMRNSSKKVQSSEDEVSGSQDFGITLGVIGFTLGTLAAMGSTRNLVKSIKAHRQEKWELVEAKEKIRVYHAHVAQGCRMVDAIDGLYASKQTALLSIERASEQLNSICSWFNSAGKLESVQSRVSSLFLKTCQQIESHASGPLLKQAVATCYDNFQTQSDALERVCAVGDDKIREFAHELEINRAELRGLKTGLCPLDIPEQWLPPEISLQNTGALLEYYPKCKRPVRAGHSRYCWSSCITMKEVPNHCASGPWKKKKSLQLFDFDDVGIVATNAAGESIAGHSMKCTWMGMQQEKVRTLCKVTFSGTVRGAQSSSLAQVQENTISSNTKTGIFGEFGAFLGIAYALISITGGLTAMTLHATKLVQAQQALVIFTEDHISFEQKAFCRVATSFMMEVASTHAIAVGALVEHFVEADIDVAPYVEGKLESAQWATRFDPDSLRTEGEVAQAWAMGSSEAQRLLTVGSSWACHSDVLEPGKGCLMPAPTKNRSSTSQPDALCSTSLGDFRICGQPAKDVVPVVLTVAPRVCFHTVVAEEGVRKLSFMGPPVGIALADEFDTTDTDGGDFDESACVRPLLQAQRNREALAKAEEDLFAVCVERGI